MCDCKNCFVSFGFGLNNWFYISRFCPLVESLPGKSCFWKNQRSWRKNVLRRTFKFCVWSVDWSGIYKRSCFYGNRFKVRKSVFWNRCNCKGNSPFAYSLNCPSRISSFYGKADFWIFFWKFFYEFRKNRVARCNWCKNVKCSSQLVLVAGEFCLKNLSSFKSFLCVFSEKLTVFCKFNRTLWPVKKNSCVFFFKPVKILSMLVLMQ